MRWALLPAAAACPGELSAEELRVLVELSGRKAHTHDHPTTPLWHRQFDFAQADELAARCEAAGQHVFSAEVQLRAYYEESVARCGPEEALEGEADPDSRFRRCAEFLSVAETFAGMHPAVAFASGALPAEYTALVCAPPRCAAAPHAAVHALALAHAERKWGVRQLPPLAPGLVRAVRLVPYRALRLDFAVVGTPGCGSTMTQALLQAHPAVGAFARNPSANTTREYRGGAVFSHRLLPTLADAEELNATRALRNPQVYRNADALLRLLLIPGLRFVLNLCLPLDHIEKDVATAASQSHRLDAGGGNVSFYDHAGGFADLAARFTRAPELLFAMALLPSERIVPVPRAILAEDLGEAWTQLQLLLDLPVAPLPRRVAAGSFRELAARHRGGTATDRRALQNNGVYVRLRRGVDVCANATFREGVRAAFAADYDAFHAVSVFPSALMTDHWFRLQD